MLSRHVHSRDDVPADAGMTLVELLVGMILMMIVGAIALNFFVGTTTQANRVTEQSLTIGSARAAMTQIVKTLQVADSPTANAGYSAGRFVTLSPTEVTFYSDVFSTGRSGTTVRSAPVEVDFKLANGTLTESLYAPQSSTAPSNYPSTPTSKNTLATNVTNSTVFTYCSDATDPSVTCTPTTNPVSVAMVQVTITVQRLSGTTPQTVQSGIAIPGQIS